MITVRLPPEIAERLDALAKRTGRTKTFYVCEAILNQLEDIEDLYLAEQTWLEHQASGEPTIPLEEIVKRQGMEV